jgi:hypothetical protein
MKCEHLLTAALVVVCLSASTAWAQRGHGGGLGGGVSGPSASGHANADARHTTDHDAAADHKMSGSPGASTGSMAHATDISTRLGQNAALSSRLQALLPAGANLQQEAMGFRNLGQFTAAAHVSKNLGIPFDQLKAKMTGPNAESLGKAIHDLRPGLDNKTVKTDVKVAEKQARTDLEATEQQKEAAEARREAAENDR